MSLGEAFKEWCEAVDRVRLQQFCLLKQSYIHFFSSSFDHFFNAGVQVGPCSALTPAAPALADAVGVASAALCAAASPTALLWSHPEDGREKTLYCQTPGRIAEDGSWCVTTHFPSSPEPGLFISCNADSSPY